MSSSLHLVSLTDAPLRQVVSKSGESLSLQCDLSERFGLSRLRLSFERIAPGARQAPPHNHSKREEGFLVLRGSGTAIVDGKRTPVVAGDVVIFRPGDASLHTLANDGPIDLEVFVFSAEEDGDAVTYGERA